MKLWFLRRVTTTPSLLQPRHCFQKRRYRGYILCQSRLKMSCHLLTKYIGNLENDCFTNARISGTRTDAATSTAVPKFELKVYVDIICNSSIILLHILQWSLYLIDTLQPQHFYLRFHCVLDLEVVCYSLSNTAV